MLGELFWLMDLTVVNSGVLVVGVLRLIPRLVAIPGAIRSQWLRCLT